MGWGLMWLLVADARGKRKGGEKAFSTNRFHCQRWIIALLHTHFLTFYCWHWMANFPFAECLKISQNCEILQILQKWYFLSDFPTPWLLLYAMKTLVFSEKREKVVTSRGWWPSSPWQLRSHFLLRKKVFLWLASVAAAAAATKSKESEAPSQIGKDSPRHCRLYFYIGRHKAYDDHPKDSWAVCSQSKKRRRHKKSFRVRNRRLPSLCMRQACQAVAE